MKFLILKTKKDVNKASTSCTAKMKGRGFRPCALDRYEKIHPIQAC